MARLACYDALSSPPAKGRAPAAAPEQAPAATASPPAAGDFGLDRPTQPAGEGVDSYIPGVFPGWSSGSVIRLANGQAWQVTDGSWLSGEWKEPKVRVRRGLLGGYRLQIEGLNREIGVRRVK